jgi:hypothetical protein
LPRVRITRHPPTYVPIAMARAQATLTQIGTDPVSVQWPAAMSARVMTPMVFCASLVPWASETSEALPIWPHRKPWLVKRSATPAMARKMNQVPSAATRTGDDRRRDPGEDHLAEDAVELGAVAGPLDAAQAQGGDRRPDQPAEEGMGGRRREARAAR